MSPVPSHPAMFVDPSGMVRSQAKRLVAWQGEDVVVIPGVAGTENGVDVEQALEEENGILVGDIAAVGAGDGEAVLDGLTQAGLVCWCEWLCDCDSLDECVTCTTLAQAH